MECQPSPAATSPLKGVGVVLGHSSAYTRNVTYRYSHAFTILYNCNTITLTVLPGENARGEGEEEERGKEGSWDAPVPVPGGTDGKASADARGSCTP